MESVFFSLPLFGRCTAVYYLITVGLLVLWEYIVITPCLFEYCLIARNVLPEYCVITCGRITIRCNPICAGLSAQTVLTITTQCTERS